MYYYHHVPSGQKAPARCPAGPAPISSVPLRAFHSPSSDDHHARLPNGEFFSRSPEAGILLTNNELDVTGTILPHSRF